MQHPYGQWLRGVGIISHFATSPDAKTACGRTGLTATNSVVDVTCGQCRRILSRRMAGSDTYQLARFIWLVNESK